MPFVVRAYVPLPEGRPSLSSARKKAHHFWAFGEERRSKRSNDKGLAVVIQGGRIPNT